MQHGIYVCTYEDNGHYLFTSLYGWSYIKRAEYPVGDSIFNCINSFLTEDEHPKQYENKFVLFMSEHSVTLYYLVKHQELDRFYIPFAGKSLPDPAPDLFISPELLLIGETMLALLLGVKVCPSDEDQAAVATKIYQKVQTRITAILKRSGV